MGLKRFVPGGGAELADRVARLEREVADLRRHNLRLAAFFCRFLPPTGFVAAVGGSTSGGCNPPARMPVDWVVGSPDVTFSDYVIDESTVNRRISDHFYISATATVAPAGDG